MGVLAADRMALPNRSKGHVIRALNLIHALTADPTPVCRLRPPGARAAYWLLLRRSSWHCSASAGVSARISSNVCRTLPSSPG